MDVSYILAFLALVWLLWAPVFGFWWLTQNRPRIRRQAWAFIGAYLALVLFGFIVWRQGLSLLAFGWLLVAALTIGFVVHSNGRSEK